MNTWHQQFYNKQMNHECCIRDPAHEAEESVVHDFRHKPADSLAKAQHYHSHDNTPKVFQPNCSQWVHNWVCFELEFVEKVVREDVEQSDDQSDVEDHLMPLKWFD